MGRKKILEALLCCTEFMCGQCPYHHYEDKDHPLRCIHLLTKDLYTLLKEHGIYELE